MRLFLTKLIAITSFLYELRYGVTRESPDLFNDTNQGMESINNRETHIVDENNKPFQVRLGSEVIIGSKTSAQDSKDLESALSVRCGDLGKSGPGPKAKAEARRNSNKGSGSNIIQGVSAYTPQYSFHIYHKKGGLPSSQSKIEAGVSNFNDGLTPRIAPTVAPNRQNRMNSQPLRIKSIHQKSDVTITKKNIKKWITPAQRKETSNQRINEQKVEDKFATTVKNPNEVIDGIHIHRKQKTCKVYIQDIQNSDGTQEKLALIADTENGRSYLGSTLTNQEYLNLKETGKIDLFDLRRDPQTLVMNQKSIQEAEALSRAKDEGCLTEFTDIRRPYNVSESLADFVGKDSMGSKINFDIKAIDGSGRRPLDRQTQDINQNIKDLFDGADDPTKFQIICDISSAPTFLQETIIKKITQGFDSNQLKNINFLF